MSIYQEKSFTYPQPPLSAYKISNVIPAGIVGGILLILFFVILRTLGLHMEHNLRWINFLLVIPVAVYSINKYINTPAVLKSYLQAFVVSLSACLMSYLLLSIFMFIYLLIDTDFMTFLYNSAYPELKLTPLSIVLLLMFEGAVGGVIISFVTLQFFKDRFRKVA